jgi:hypothetical protein
LVLVNMERSSLTSPSVVATAVFIHGLLASLDLVGAALHHVDLGPEPPLRLDGPDASVPSLCPKGTCQLLSQASFPDRYRSDYRGNRCYRSRPATIPTSW